PPPPPPRGLLLRPLLGGGALPHRRFGLDEQGGVDDRAEGAAGQGEALVPPGLLVVAGGEREPFAL
ncbi:MAG: hypothetical protein DIU79_09480, partial [Actinobacteria bacterium]